MSIIFSQASFIKKIGHQQNELQYFKLQIIKWHSMNFKETKQKNPIDSLIQTLSKMPGLGQRSAMRTIYHMLSRKDDVLTPFLNQINMIASTVKNCQQCHNLAFDTLCIICNDMKRDLNAICIVEKPQDIHAIEKAQFYRGTYHVIGGLLSAFNGITPQDLKIETLIKRMQDQQVSEIIFALPATQDGRTTLHYISDKLADFDIKITMPAQGMPLGSDLDFIDQGTMATAFGARIDIT
ncbi:MAG: recombination protein RecR [Alphaproteobacteria bacterium]|jgi:recombination protein RecR